MEDTRNNILELDLPIKEGLPGYSGVFFRYYGTLAAIAADSKGETDFRIVMLTSAMISSITDPEVRTKLITLKQSLIKQGIEDFEKSGRKIGVDDRNRIIVDACFLVIGKISEFMDMFLGITRKTEVSLE